MELRLALAEKLVDLERFYFPYQIDFRARVYPVPQLINPQLDDIARSQLEFADGKPLGERGARYLAVHMANCYWKKSKLSFEKMIAWVHEHEQEIVAYAENPVGAHQFWLEADKPWCLRAACKEWKGYLAEGPNFVSHLPISMDGSCNGYQHLSAMSRDPIGGRATNLLPGDDPEDIYLEVARLVLARIERDAAMIGEPWVAVAREWLGKIDRRVVKHATMTTPYGVTERTIYKELLKSDVAALLENPKGCCRYLAKVLVETIPQVAVQAATIMNWFRDLTLAIAKENRPLSWTGPTGFVVVLERRKPREVRITTKRRTFVVHRYDAKRKIDARKQADGIVAHFVHSMDAAHMMRTINRLVAEGIIHFAMIHDSYGVHACDVDLLNRILREEFVRIYSEPVLQNFLDEQRKAHPNIDLPDVPPLGDLDIRQVLLSQYFFS
jgi:DNA-directed RNA polymerase